MEEHYKKLSSRRGRAKGGKEASTTTPTGHEAEREVIEHGEGFLRDFQ